MGERLHRISNNSQRMYAAMALFLCLSFGSMACTYRKLPAQAQIISYIVDPKKRSIALYWKDENGHLLRSLKNLKNYVNRHNQQLLFAANGGMYEFNRAPVGLFIHSGQMIVPLNIRSGRGNFYLKPNGVFFLTTDNRAGVSQSAEFRNKSNITFATQSGPMLVINGKIHPKFKPASNHLNIRNGVGILPNGEVIFIMSTYPINLYNFASYFKTLGCKNALYLDGHVSQTYLPEKNWQQLGGNFGVMIGVTVPRRNNLTQ